MKRTKLASEHGVYIPDDQLGNKKQSKYDDRMKHIREVVLYALQEESKKRTEILRCLDVTDGFGIAGLQWKKRFKEKVHVVINSVISVDEVNKFSVDSKITAETYPLDFHRVPGEEKPVQQDSQVHVCMCSSNVLLHLEAFDFIYLVPCGSLTGYLDAVFTNLSNNGILCVASADISSQFTRSSHAIQRYYAANVIKTDYMREMAVRVIVGAMARSSAKCNKGIEVLLSTCIDDFYLIVVRVVRGPSHADKAVDSLRNLLHCQMCEERRFLPNSQNPIEFPYKLLQCQCQVNTAGKTAVVLGPMWYGNIFCSDFVTSLMDSSDSDLSDKLKHVLTAIKEESLCPTEDPTKHSAIESNGCLNEVKEPPQKRKKTGQETEEVIIPQFFYNLHRRKFKWVDLPKTGKLLTLLRCEGFRASRTHFDSQGVRTSATLEQLNEVLLKFCKKKS